MKYFFQLQYRRLERKMSEFGVIPLLGVAILVILFVLLSKYLFYKIEEAHWFYVAISLLFVINLGNSSRIEKLSKIFKKNEFERIRLIENLSLAIPFSLFILYEGVWLFAMIPLLLALILFKLNINFSRSIVWPTPFKKFPFEFIIGFRKSLFLIILAYFLFVKGIHVDNANLSIASMGMLFLISMSYCSKPERIYFIWIFNKTTITFLSYKIQSALSCTLILTLPMLIGLVIFFSNRLWAVSLVFFIGFLLVVTMILAKYSAFPKEISLPQALLIGLSLWFPPFILFTIPIFYKQALKRLKPFVK